MQRSRAGAASVELPPRQHSTGRDPHQAGLGTGTSALARRRLAGEEGAAGALREVHTRPMDFSGKPLRSMVFVGPGGTRGAAALKGRVERGVAFARTLPPRTP